MPHPTDILIIGVRDEISSSLTRYLVAAVHFNSSIGNTTAGGSFHSNLSIVVEWK